MKVITERCWAGSQSWNYEKVAQTPTHKYRVTIKRDTYDKQSYAKVDLWNKGEENWTPVLSRSIGELGCAVVSYVQRGITAQNFKVDGMNMLADARQIVED